MSETYCTIDKNPVPPERTKRKGLASVTCKDECYAELRRQKKHKNTGRRVSAEDRALLLRFKRAKFTISDFSAFASWWGDFRRAK